MDISDARPIVVTGSTDGIGKETARRLAALGARVVVHGRDERKAVQARDELRKATGRDDIESAAFDLSSLQAVREGAAALRERFPALRALVNNAGVYAGERSVTGEGFELTFQVNHLAPFLLTRLLLPALVRGARGHGLPARIVNVSSQVHASGSIHWDDLQLERGYSGYSAYAQSKLANVLFTAGLAVRLDSNRITANSLHPGVIGTKMLSKGFGMSGGAPVSEGAATSVFLASAPEVASITGRYFVDSREQTPSLAARDPEARDRLWELSSELTGLPAAIE